MKKLLEDISKRAISSGKFNFTPDEINSKWLGKPPASETDIKFTEKRLGVILPDDYKNFLQITNGFSTPNDAIEPTFEKAERITFLKDIDPFLIEVWSKGILTETGKALAKSIVIAGVDEEQYFLLIPPDQKHGNWKYWKFANWIPGEEPYENLEAYFTSVLDFLKTEK